MFAVAVAKLVRLRPPSPAFLRKDRLADAPFCFLSINGSFFEGCPFLFVFSILHFFGLYNWTAIVIMAKIATEYYINRKTGH